MFQFLKRICLIALFIGLGLSAQAQPGANTLYGRITDSSAKKGIEQVNIYFPDLRRGAVSDLNGYYRISGISAGSHLVEVSHVGYNNISQVVNIKGSTEMNFLLKGEVVEQNAVVVTGVTRATRLKSMPFQVSVINAEGLSRLSSSNLIESLGKTPGLSTTTTGPAISKPIIRGMGYNRVITLSDGIRQEGQQWGDEHGIEVDEFSVQKVEVLKGPASLIYGSDAMGGVLNIIQNVPAPLNRFTASAGVGYQSNNRERNASLNLAANHKGFNWRLFGSAKAAADYKNAYDGFVFNSKFREQNIGGYAGANGNWGFTHLIFGQYHLQPGLVEGERDDEGRFLKLLPGGDEVPADRKDFLSIKSFIPYQDINHSKIALANHFNIGRQHLSVNTGWQKNVRKEFGNPVNPDEPGLNLHLQSFTYNARLDFETNNSLKPSIGINGMVQQNVNHGTEQLIPDYNSSEVGAFFFAQQEVGKATLSGGLRYDIKQLNVKELMEGAEVKGNSFNRNYGNFSGSLGLAYELNKDLVLKGNIARAYRAPGIAELGVNGRHEGTNRYEYGNNNLQSETSLQGDLSLEFTNEHLNLMVAAFYNSFNNYIFYNKLLNAAGADSTVEVDGSAIPAFRFNQQNASIKGIEFFLDLHPHPLHWLHFENTLSILAGRFSKALDGSKNIPYMPSARLISELRADLHSKNKLLRDIYFSIELDNTFKQNKAFTGFNTETSTPGYSLLNAGAGFSLYNRAGTKAGTINFSAQNITDKAYQSHLNRLKYAPENPATGRLGVYNMGRNFSVKLSLPINVVLKSTNS